MRADEWINKSLNKRHLKIVEVDVKGQQRVLAEWAAFAGPGGYRELFESMFRWADLRMDPDVVWQAEDEFGFDPASDEISPYANTAAEVDHWSLELQLGELARAFILVDEYGRTGSRQLEVRP